MKRLAIMFLIFFSLGCSGAFADNGDTNHTWTVVPETPKTIEKRRAIEDVNTLIIDSYRVQLDRILKELYENIRVATKGDKDAQVRILDKVRSDLDDRLDSLSTSNVTSNRKKILMWVYFYLKSRIEGKIDELRWNTK